MEPAPQPDVLEQLKLIADETRWRLIQALRWSDYQVGELVDLLDMPQNLLSYHLNLLRQAGLVQVHRSDADARANYYGIDLSAMVRFYFGLGTELHLSAAHPSEIPPHTVVFLCTANSARSQMAEGWLRHLSGGRLSARSAGTRPAQLHPLAVEVMAEAGIDIGYQQAKSVEALTDLGPELVVTVCDIAREECVVWRNAARRLHWSIPDPAAEADPAVQIEAFRNARDDLRRRVEGLIALLPNLSYP
jgi:protein-tyrosine-phosphatase/DNA-binding transcriptional ArsR family regulator